MRCHLDHVRSYEGLCLCFISVKIAFLDSNCQLIGKKFIQLAGAIGTFFDELMAIYRKVIFLNEKQPSFIKTIKLQNKVYILYIFFEPN